jgi:hypothetical protein
LLFVSARLKNFFHESFLNLFHAVKQKPPWQHLVFVQEFFQSWKKRQRTLFWGETAGKDFEEARSNSRAHLMRRDK